MNTLKSIMPSATDPGFRLAILSYFVCIKCIRKHGIRFKLWHMEKIKQKGYSKIMFIFPISTDQASKLQNLSEANI